jgi:hypothetical protein
VSVVLWAIDDASHNSNLPVTICLKNELELKEGVLLLATIQNSQQKKLRVLLYHGGGFDAGTCLLVQE